MVAPLWLAHHAWCCLQSAALPLMRRFCVAFAAWAAPNRSLAWLPALQLLKYFLQLLDLLYLCHNCHFQVINVAGALCWSLASCGHVRLAEVITDLLSNDPRRASFISMCCSSPMVHLLFKLIVLFLKQLYLFLECSCQLRQMHWPSWGVSGRWIHSRHLWYGRDVYLLSALALRFWARARLRAGLRRCYQPRSLLFLMILGILVWWEWLSLIEARGHTIGLTYRICRDNWTEDSTVLRHFWSRLESLLRQLNLHLRLGACMGRQRRDIF